MLSLALLLSSFTLPTPPLDTSLMPRVLVEAQQQAITRPEQCLHLANDFLQRDLVDKILPLMTQNPGTQREPDNYRTRQQTVEARLIAGDCLYQLNQNDNATRMLNQALQEAKQFKLPTQESIAYYLLARQALLDLHDYKLAYQNLSRLQSMLGAGQFRSDWLPIYGKLLQISMNLDLRQYDKVREDLANLPVLPGNGQPVSLAVAIQTLQGDYYLARQQQDMALIRYADALNTAIVQNAPYLQAKLSEKISRIFEQQGDLKQAMHYSELACDQWQQLGNNEWLANGLIHLARLNRENGDNSLSLSLLFNVLDIYRHLNRPHPLASLNFEIGQTYMQMNNLNAARVYLQAARNGFNLLKDQRGELDVLMVLADMHLRMNEPGMAIALLENVAHEPELEVPLRYQLIAKAYEQKGQYRQAFDNLKLYTNGTASASRQMLSSSNEQLRDNYWRVELERNVSTLKDSQQQLTLERNHYLWLSALCGSLTICFGLYVLQLIRQVRRLKTHSDELKQQLGQAQVSELPNSYQLHEHLVELDFNLQQRDQQQEPVAGWQLSHIFVPALSRAAEKLGSEKASQLQLKISSCLSRVCSGSEKLYQLTDSRFLLMQPIDDAIRQQRLGEQLLEKIEALLNELNLAPRVQIGLAQYPFLRRCPQAIPATDVVELSLLALSGAEQLSEKTHQSSWLELSAIDCQQAAFFNGAIRERALSAIDKGLVKVNASHNKHLVNWHTMDAQIG